jgi:hypothetical protein
MLLTCKVDESQEAFANIQSKMTANLRLIVISWLFMHRNWIMPQTISFWVSVYIISFYYIKYSALLRFRALIKMIISHVRLFMIISHVKIIAFQLSLFCKNYRFSKTVLYVEHDIITLVHCAHLWDIMFNTQNKSGISVHALHLTPYSVALFIFVLMCWWTSEDLHPYFVDT